MQQAAALLLGEHDFTSFRAAACQALSPVKNLMRISHHPQRSAILAVRVRGQCLPAPHGAQHHGLPARHRPGQTSPGLDAAQVLQARSRDAAAPTFSPEGLYFLGPRYASHWGLPERTDRV
jgi:tRNA pseudouridine38-40 synthase